MGIINSGSSGIIVINAVVIVNIADVNDNNADVDDNNADVNDNNANVDDNNANVIDYNADVNDNNANVNDDSGGVNNDFRGCKTNIQAVNGLYLNIEWNRKIGISLLEPFTKGLLSLVPGAPAEHTGTTGANFFQMILAGTVSSLSKKEFIECKNNRNSCSTANDFQNNCCADCSSTTTGDKCNSNRN